MRIVATVSDPDGLANIARVEVRVNGGSPFLLCDDGGQGACNGSASGDDESGDGLYTVTFGFGSGNTGTFSMEFVAVDRAGLESNRVTRTLIIE